MKRDNSAKVDRDIPSQNLIDLKKMDSAFAREVDEQSGECIGLCFHCRSCESGCPYIGAMDYSPHAVLRLVQFGLRSEALACSTIWVCVGCNTCAIQCPMAIDLSGVMDTLRHMALKVGARVPEPDILEFHRQVLESIKRHGRANKLEIMLRYKLRRLRLIEDMRLGLKMLAKRKLHLTPVRIKGKDEVSRLFKAFPSRDDPHDGP